MYQSFCTGCILLHYIYMLMFSKQTTIVFVCRCAHFPLEDEMLTKHTHTFEYDCMSFDFLLSE